jgi:hypothetical protein
MMIASFVSFETNTFEDDTDRAAMHTLGSVETTKSRNKRINHNEQKREWQEMRL